MRRHSIGRDLTRRLGGLVLVFSALTAFGAYHLAHWFSDDAYDEWLLDTARSLGQVVQVKANVLQADLPLSTLQAVVFDASDKVLFRIDSPEQGLIAGHNTLSPLGKVDDDEPTVQYHSETIENQPMRVVRLIRRDIMPGTPVVITVAETLHKRERLASHLLGTILAISALLTFLTARLVRDVVKRGLAPMQALSAAIRQRRRGDLDRLQDAGVPRELATFTGAINDLLGQLDQATQMQKRFVADAAHQLRTPLATLKVELTHAQRENDPEKHREALANLGEGIDRLARLSDQLLSLARAEPGALRDQQLQTVNLTDLAKQAAGRFINRSIAEGIDFGFEGEDAPTLIRGDALLLEECVNNLVDNALRYAGTDAQVTVSVRAQGEKAYLTVEDNGPGVSASDLPHLAERFHRPQSSLPGGSGLGLAIVKEIAQTHGGTLHIDTAIPHGLRVTLSFPRLSG